MSERAKHPEDEGIPDLFDDEEVALPGERPAAARDRVTASEQRERETLRARVARETPDAHDERSTSGDETPGRFHEETVEGEDVTREVEATETSDDAALSAEEAAMREEPER